MKKKNISYLKSRTKSLLSMATKVALKEGKTLINKSSDQRLKKMVEQADIIVKHVGQLKGAAMKAVQMLSLEGQDFLPPEVIHILEKLHSQAPPVDNQLMKETLLNELGKEKFNRLEELSEKPFASASIGQVYRAQYNGRPIVIKVQYPDISNTIDSDLRTLRKLISSLLFLYGKNIDIDELLEEVKDVLKRETNYQIECENIQRYSKNFENDDRYVIPQVFPELSTEKVLVMSQEAGLELAQWKSTDPSPEKVNSVGQKLLELYNKEFFEHGFVQTDPNPANFLINEKEQLVLLDFGAALEYDRDFIKRYKKLAQTIFTGTDQQILDEIHRLDFLSIKETDQTNELFLDFLKMSMLPFQDSSQPFDFKENNYSNEVRRRALAFTKAIKYSAPPRQLIFLHRKLGGLFFLLKKIELKADIRKFRELPEQK